MLSFNSRYFFSSLIIAAKSLCLISLIINGSDISLFILINLLLANITILLCFVFLFRVFLNNFFTIPVKIENARLKLELAIPTGAQINTANNAIEILPVVTDKKINDLSK